MNCDDIVKVTQELLPSVFGAPSWDPWRTALSALFGLPIQDTELAKQCSGRTEFKSAREGWFVVGRRGGKSQIAALIAVYLSIFRKYKVAPGETPVFMCIAADRRQATVVHRYVSGLLHSHPSLEIQISKEIQSRIELLNGIHIEVHTADFRSVRGHTVIGAVCDEIAFWKTDESSASPDTEILNALRPAMVTVPNALLIAISSPYARRGELWRAYKNYYGKKDSDVLVWKAPTVVMNPVVPKWIITRAYENDPPRAAAEYGANFRTDIESYIPREIIEALITTDVVARPPISSQQYRAFVDPSGGSSDSMTLGIAHKELAEDKESTTMVLDCVLERRPPFSPEQVVSEFTETLKAYRVDRVVGDRYGGEWPREQFRNHGVAYDLSKRTKNEIYRDLLPVLNSGRCQLLDQARLVTQLIGLERRTARGGRDSIDHAPGGHDDVANAAAGVIVLEETSKMSGAVW